MVENTSYFFVLILSFPYLTKSDSQQTHPELKEFSTGRSGINGTSDNVSDSAFLNKLEGQQVSSSDNSHINENQHSCFSDWLHFYLSEEGEKVVVRGQKCVSLFPEKDIIRQCCPFPQNVIAKAHIALEVGDTSSLDSDHGNVYFEKVKSLIDSLFSWFPPLRINLAERKQHLETASGYSVDQPPPSFFHYLFVRTGGINALDKLARDLYRWLRKSPFEELHPEKTTSSLIWVFGPLFSSKREKPPNISVTGGKEEPRLSEGLELLGTNVSYPLIKWNRDFLEWIPKTKTIGQDNIRGISLGPRSISSWNISQPIVDTGQALMCGRFKSHGSGQMKSADCCQACSILADMNISQQTASTKDTLEHVYVQIYVIGQDNFIDGSSDSNFTSEINMSYSGKYLLRPANALNESQFCLDEKDGWSPQNDILIYIPADAEYQEAREVKMDDICPKTDENIGVNLTTRTNAIRVLSAKGGIFETHSLSLDQEANCDCSSNESGHGGLASHLDRHHILDVPGKQPHDVCPFTWNESRRPERGSQMDDRVGSVCRDRKKPMHGLLRQAVRIWNAACAIFRLSPLPVYSCILFTCFALLSMLLSRLVTICMGEFVQALTKEIVVDPEWQKVAMAGLRFHPPAPSHPAFDRPSAAQHPLHKTSSRSKNTTARSLVMSDADPAKNRLVWSEEAREEVGMDVTTFALRTNRFLLEDDGQNQCNSNMEKFAEKWKPSLDIHPDARFSSVSDLRFSSSEDLVQQFQKLPAGGSDIVPEATKSASYITAFWHSASAYSRDGDVIKMAAPKSSFAGVWWRGQSVVVEKERVVVVGRTSRTHLSSRVEEFARVFAEVCVPGETACLIVGRHSCLGARCMADRPGAAVKRRN